MGLVPAAQYAAKLPHQLSGGQRQRVLIARALGSDPDLIVADEPVSMLDVSLRAGVLKLLAELRRTRGLSLLYITHDLLSARLITDEILVLNQGRVVERGQTKQVLQHPTDKYTIQLLNAVANPFAANGSEQIRPEQSGNGVGGAARGNGVGSAARGNGAGGPATGTGIGGPTDRSTQ